MIAAGEKFNFNKPDKDKLKDEKEKIFISTTYIDLTRHGNRFGGPMKVTLNKLENEPLDIDDTQALTPRGRQNSAQFGAQSYQDVSLVHPRGGDELRHGQTGEDILKGSGKFGDTRETPSPVLKNDKVKGSRRGKGIDYASSGVMGVLKEVKTLINNTLQQLVDNLTEEEQQRFREDPEFRAILREQAQVTGLKFAIENTDPKMQEAMLTLAKNEAKELVHDVILSRRGVKDDKTKAITLVGSGLFAESLFKHALVVEDIQTGEKKIGFTNVDEIGGFTKQASAFRIKLTRNNSKGDARNSDDFEKDTTMECEFVGDPERQKLFEGKKLYLDWQKVLELAKE